MLAASAALAAGAVLPRLVSGTGGAHLPRLVATSEAGYYTGYPGTKVEESEKVKEFKVAVEDGPDLGDFIAGVVPRWVTGLAGGGLDVPLCAGRERGTTRGN